MIDRPEPKLGINEAKTEISEIDLDWKVVDDYGTLKMTQVYNFKNFQESLDFVNAIVDPIQRHNHHPEIHIDFSEVTLIMWSHNYDGLTEKDIDVAKEIDIKFSSFIAS